MSVMKTAAVVLAAGKSERMGRNKLLLKLHQRTLIDIVLDALETSEINEIVVVVGHRPDEILRALKPRLDRVKIAINEEYEEGMASSFQAGLKEVVDADAAFLVLGDEPILDCSFLKVMIGRMEKDQDNVSIISPIYKGKKGHPLLFHKRLFKEIMNLKKTEIIRDVVHRHANAVLTIEAPEWTIMDVDTPDELALMRAFAQERTQLEN
jgi:molybdenum cofactor cytidylyltransferase